MSKWNLTSIKTKAVLTGLALSLLCQPASFADEALRKISFVNSLDGTEIILDTGRTVPYAVVYADKEKIVLDVSDVNSQGAVQTNFTQARNVSHVILKPLSDNKVRLIIRGEELGAPLVGFAGSSGASNSASTPHANGGALSMPAFTKAFAAPAPVQQPKYVSDSEHSAINVPGESNVSVALPPKHVASVGSIQVPPDESIPNRGPDVTVTAQAPQTAKLPVDGAAKQNANVPGLAFAPKEGPVVVNTLSATAVTPGVDASKLALLKKQLKSIPEPKQSPAEQTFQGVLEGLYANKWVGLGIQIVLALVALVVASLVIINKVRKLLVDVQPRETRQSQRARFLDEPSRPSASGFNSGRQASLERPIGLRSFEPNTPQSTKVAMNQYLKQAAVPPQDKQKRTLTASERLMQEELLQAIDPRKAPTKPAPKAAPGKGLPPLPPRAKQPSLKAGMPSPYQAQKPQPSRAQAQAAQGHELKENTEVLSFLRSVADMMEKDGKTGMAQSVNRGLERHRSESTSV